VTNHTELQLCTISLISL